MRLKIICFLVIAVCAISICGSTRAEMPATPTDLVPLEPEIIRIPPTVTVYWDARPVMREGEEVHIYTVITNAEYWIFTYQWFYSTDSSNWILIPGATQPTYTFNATKETLSYSYRIEVTYYPLG